MVVAVVLHGDYAMIHGGNETAHANIASVVQKRLIEMAGRYRHIHTNQVAIRGHAQRTVAVDLRVGTRLSR